MHEEELLDRLKVIADQTHALRDDPLRLSLLKSDLYDLSRKPNMSDTGKVIFTMLKVIVECAEDH